MDWIRSAKVCFTICTLAALSGLPQGSGKGLKMRWRMDNEYVNLNLQENDHVTSSAPVFVSRNGLISTWNSTNAKDFKAYVDPENKAAILIEGTDGGRKSYRGIFRKDDKEFVLNPVSRTSPRSPRSRRDADDDALVDLGDVTSLVSDGKDEIPEGFVFNDTTADNDVAVSLRRSNTISSLPIETGRKMYYGVETVIFVDHAIFQRWYEQAEGDSPIEKEDNAINNIRFYFSHVANGLDVRYNGIDEPDFGIYVILNGIFIAMGPEDAPFVEQHTTYSGPEPFVDGPYALQSFEEWIDQNKDILPPYDQATLFIGNQMIQRSEDNVQSNLLGYAHVTGMCSYFSASINLDHGYYGSILVAAHEMGHNLGAFHDGDDQYPASAPCTPKDQYVMAAYLGSTTDDNFYNPFSFSSCSITQFRNFFNTLNLENKNCLLTSAGSVGENDLESFLNEKPGQRFTPNQQCQHIYGSRSYHCAGQGAGDSICKSMQCYDLVEEDCKAEANVRASDGTTCGNNMWCIKGDCVYDPRAPEASDECTFGDFKGSLDSGETCADMVHDSPWLCYREIEGPKCCESCKRIADESDKECQYGDKSSWCKDIAAEDCYNPDYESSCCRTCASYKTNQKGCEYGDLDADLCTNLPVRKCYAHEKTCCSFCASVKANNEECPYGDQTEWCAEHISNSPSECYRDHTTCCASCMRQKTNIQGCEYGDRMDACQAWMCDDPYYKEQGMCCATCSQRETNKTTPPAPTTPEPTTPTPTKEPEPACTDKAGWCMYFIGQNLGLCYHEGTYNLCCNACRHYRSSNPNCPYGDMYTDCQPYHCDASARECCVTCGL